MIRIHTLVCSNGSYIILICTTLCPTNICILAHTSLCAINASSNTPSSTIESLLLYSKVFMLVEITTKGTIHVYALLFRQSPLVVTQSYYQNTLYAQYYLGCHRSYVYYQCTLLLFLLFFRNKYTKTDKNVYTTINKIPFMIFLRAN